MQGGHAIDSKMQTLHRPAQGLYIHIPFCRSICHYCDFAKTANFQQHHVTAYLEILSQQLTSLESFITRHDPKPLTSVFFGGGTPGLITTEYRDLLKQILSFCAEDAEITIETNPEDISSEALDVWRDLGFNRLSMGVQSFHDTGLRIMTRQHDSKSVQKATDLIAEAFPNFNIDLIYGWPTQTLDQWHRDLSMAMASGASHISAYNMIIEEKTPFGLKVRRGKLKDLPDNLHADMYQSALDFFKVHDWVQDEVSNWTRQGYTCKHNWLYWQNQSFYALGTGAFGLDLSTEAYGSRYYFPRDLRRYLALEAAPLKSEATFLQILQEMGATIEPLTEEHWLYETVGGGLRTRKGICLDKIKSQTNRSFSPTSKVEDGLKNGKLTLSDGTLTLSPDQWFLENQWALAVIDSFPVITPC